MTRLDRSKDWWLSRAASEPDVPISAGVEPIPVALQRLIDEIRAEKPTDTSLYNRSYHRHNR